jgi:hypothetical protein
MAAPSSISNNSNSGNGDNLNLNSEYMLVDTVNNNSTNMGGVDS